MTRAIYLLYVILACLSSFIRSSWIDPDTEPANHVITSFVSNTPYKLVFSDEFNVDNRIFHDGNDPRWTAINKNDYTNYALHYYSHDLAHTQNGYLNISTIIKDISFNIQDYKDGNAIHKRLTKNYQSGMIQGWNKFCFIGGVVDIRAKLPGNGNIGGFWPAIWLLGNLARATYVSSSNNVWPWSYNVCDKKRQDQQLFSACNHVNHFKLNPLQGRGAPEIDIFEVMPGLEKLYNTPINKPYLSTSLQISPAIKDYRPVDAQPPLLDMWYNHGIEYGENASLNIFFYGMYLKGPVKEKSYLADAVSANTNIDTSFFDEFHDYRIEWMPGEEGYIQWFIDGIFRYRIDASALNITGASIPNEPMYLILNNAISSTWGFPIPCPEGCPCDCFDARREECQCAIPAKMIENFPASFLIDYIRVYQNTSDERHVLGCSTKEYPTKKYIAAHAHLYTESDDPWNGKPPLREVAKGGGLCGHIKYDLTESDKLGECGRGECVKGKCKCSEGYTGPYCRAAVGYYDVDLDPDEFDFFASWSSFTVPTSLLRLSLAILIGFLAVVGFKYLDKKSDYEKVNTSDSINV